MAQEFELQPSPKGQTGRINVPVPHYAFDMWDPALAFGGGNTGLTGSQFSTYQRIGNRCYIDTTFTLTAKGSSTGVAEIYFLPFGSWGNLPAFNVTWLNMTSTLVHMGGLLVLGILGSTAIKLVGLTAAGASLVDLTDADFSNTTEIEVSGHYTINEQG